jgi:hypothetical protein
VSADAQLRARGLGTLHRIPALRLLAVLVLDVAIPVRPVLRRLTGPPPKPRHASMWIVPAAAQTTVDVPLDLPSRDIAC